MCAIKAKQRIHSLLAINRQILNHFQESREFLLKKNAITLTDSLPCENLQMFGLNCIAVDKYLNNSCREWLRFEAMLVWGIIKTYFCFRSPKCNWQGFARPSIVISNLSFPFRNLRIHPPSVWVIPWHIFEAGKKYSSGQYYRDATSV